MVAQAKESGVLAWSTSSVPPQRVAEYWREALRSAYATFAVRLAHPASFRGEITSHPLDGYTVSVIAANAHELRRTAQLAAATDGETLLVSIQTAGRGTVEEADHSATLHPGDMTINLTSRPFAFHFEGPFEQLVVQVPVERILRLTGLDRTQIRTATSLPTTGSLAPVTSFFRALPSATDGSSHERTAVGEAGIQVVASALIVASRTEGTRPEGTPPLRDQAQRLITDHLADPSFDVNALARMCSVSRRTLYRAFAEGGEGVSSSLRRMRIERACRLLRVNGRSSLTSVAEASGFSTERQFYRAFKELNGMTPGEYRDAWHSSSPTRHT